MANFSGSAVYILTIWPVFKILLLLSTGIASLWRFGCHSGLTTAQWFLRILFLSMLLHCLWWLRWPLGWLRVPHLGLLRCPDRRSRWRRFCPVVRLAAPSLFVVILDFALFASPRSRCFSFAIEVTLSPIWSKLTLRVAWLHGRCRRTLVLALPWPVGFGCDLSNWGRRLLFSGDGRELDDSPQRLNRLALLSLGYSGWRY